MTYLNKKIIFKLSYLVGAGWPDFKTNASLDVQFAWIVLEKGSTGTTTKAVKVTLSRKEYRNVGTT